jgi:hypothetical protein
MKIKVRKEGFAITGTMPNMLETGPGVLVIYSGSDNFAIFRLIVSITADESCTVQTVDFSSINPTMNIVAFNQPRFLPDYIIM